MALLDFLKRKKEIEKSKKTEEKPAEFKPEKKSSQKITAKTGFSYDAIKRPHISEKASTISEKDNHYAFEVLTGSKKQEIKKSVEGIYGVKVLSVNIIKIPSKKRRLGRSMGFKKGFTKAIVKIKQGQKIEIL